MTVIAVACVAVLVGGLVRGYTGFGASMFWVASLSLIYSPASVVPTVLALEVLASIALLPSVFRQVHWRSMRWMLLSTVATMPLGIALLAALPDRQMRIVVALAILSATVAVASGATLVTRPGRVAALTAGSVSGLMNGSTGVGGPPAVLLYFSGASPNDVGRASLIAYFLFTDAIGFALMAGYGLVDLTVLSHTALFAPLALVGIVAGQLAFRRTGGTGLRAVVLVVLVVLSVAMLLRALLLG